MNEQQYTFSQYIKERAEKHNMTQSDIAIATKVSRSYISLWVRGKAPQPPSIKVLTRLAKTFGDFPEDVLDAAGVYDRDKLTEAISLNPDIARQIRELYEKDTQ